VNAGQRFARLATDLVVRWPRTWPLLRPIIRTQFARLAPIWDVNRSPEAFSPLEAALDAVEGPVASALDLGTGTGDAAFVVARRFPEAEVVGIDLAPEMIETARRKTPPEAKVSFEVGDASAVPRGDGTFDLVTGANVIPFFDELARLVAPGGYVALSFSVGPATPIYVPPERLRAELARRGFSEFAEFEAGSGTAFLARRR
jgi:SAM-dependent methyltransferase